METPDIPILILSGDMDPVGNYGKGVTYVYDHLKESHPNVQMTLYEEGRHELLNEINKDIIYEDILSWLNTHLVSPVSS